VESEPPPGQSEATSQVRTPPSEDTSDGEAQTTTGDEVEGGETDDEESRAETSADETAATSASARSASHTRHDEAQCEMEGPGEGDDEERRPGVPDEPFDEPNVELRDPQSVQVEPGGDTDAERNRCATLESADAEIDGRVVGTCRDAQVEVESARTRVRGSATAYARSTTAVDENGQRSEMDVEDAPEDPPESPPPMPMPDEPARLENGPPSVELEGEWKAVASCDVGLASDEADASTASGPVEDDGKWSKKLQKVSECERECSKRINEENSPGRPGDEPDEPGGEAAVPGDIHSTQERPRCETSDVVDNTNTSRRGERPGGQLDLQGEPRGEEIVPDRDKDVEHAEYDGNRPRSEENARGVETSAPCRDTGPPGHMGERIESGGDGGSRERQSNGNGDQRGGIRCGKDDATSGARSDSKRVDTSLLAEGKAGQYERRKRETTDVPRPSTPPTDTSKRPMDHPNPPRRRGRLKSRPREVSTPGGPTRPHGRAKAVSGGSDASYMMYMDRRWWRRVPAMRNAKTRPLESIEDERAHLDSATT
jgi:hypothetical protein